MKQVHEFPLREIKRARIRLALVDAIFLRMQDKPLSQITVEELCRDTEISRGTFFRYFPRKVDLIFYIYKLWEIEIIWHVINSDGASPGIEAIETVFRKEAAAIEDHPHLFSEIIALRAFEPMEFERMGNSNSIRVSEAERMIRYPDLKGIELLPEGGFPAFFRRNLDAAVKNGELPDSINIDEVHMSIACIFYGVPLMSSDKTSTNLANAYTRQVRLLWAGLKTGDGK